MGNSERRQMSCDRLAQPQKLLTPDEVAVLLGIERVTVIRLARAGKIPSIKIGKVWRFRPTTIDAWLVAEEGQA